MYCNEVAGETGRLLPDVDRMMGRPCKTATRRPRKADQLVPAQLVPGTSDGGGVQGNGVGQDFPHPGPVVCIDRIEK